MSKTYLDVLIEERDELRAKVQHVRSKIVAEARPMNDRERYETDQHRSRLTYLDGEIEGVQTEELRARKADALKAELAAGGTGAEGDQHRSGEGGQRLGTYTQDRDPGHYRSEAAGGRYSFFADQFLSRQGDERAGQRLAEHTRAMTTVGEGVGLVAPKWLSDEFATKQRQGRRAASVVRHVPLGTDPRPITLPRQTVGTDPIVGTQASENTAPTATDSYDTDVDTVSPLPITGAQVISRQMLDMASPAVDILIYEDMIGAYDAQVEAKVVAAMTTAAGAAVSTYATEAAYTTGLGTDQATYIGDRVIDAAIAVRNARKMPADILVSSVLRYGSFLKIKDESGRPLMPMDTAGPVNVIGTGEVAVDGQIHGLGVIASDGVTQYPESILVARAADTLLFESQLMRFRYEEVSGPQSIKLGIWGYVGVYVKYAGASVKRIAITAAT